MALSVAGGALNGIVAGGLSGLALLEGEAAIVLPIYGAAVGLVADPVHEMRYRPGA